MLGKLAVRTLAYERGKYIGAVFGVAMAVLLVLLQVGFYLGFRRDITVVADSFEVDLWVSQQSLLTFDYLAHFDDLVRWQILGDEDVAAATGIIAEWVRFRRIPDGATENAQILGVNLDEGIRVNLGADPNFPLVSALSLPGSVLVDEKHLDRVSGGAAGGTGVEIRGLNANVVGVMRGKKLFSTACLLVTDLDNARRFLGFSADRISFVAIRCRPGADVRVVQARLQAHLPERRVWTAAKFHGLTQDYWLKLTGIGPVLLLSAGLAALVGFLTVFLTFSHLTSEKLPMYAAMKAIGASTAELSGLVLLQIAIVFCIGSLLAIVGVLLALAALAGTTISVELPPQATVLGVGFMGICSLAAGLRSLHKLARVEPAEAFRT